MIYGEPPLGTIAPFDLYIPFISCGTLIQTNGGNSGRGPDVKFECVSIELEPIRKLQSWRINGPVRREP